MGSNATLLDDELSHHMTIRLNGRERVALSKVARDRGLSEKEAIRDLLMCAVLDIRPKKPNGGERSPSAYRASLTTHLTKGQ